jgi:hypothetical protein
MSWSKIGETPAAIPYDAGLGTQDVTLPGSPATGDLVLVLVGGDVSCQNTITTAGYTTPENTTGASPGAHFGYKVMGATPDSVVTVQKDSAVYKCVVVQVWRGGDAASILDQAYSSVATLNPPSIVTQSDDALVVAIAVIDDKDTTVATWPSGYTNGLETNTGLGSTNAGTSVALSSKVVASAGTEDPSTYAFNAADVYLAGTISFKMGTTVQNYSLSAVSGSFAETGTAATLKTARKLSAVSGSFAETGTAATLKFNHPLAAGSGAFVESGTAAGLLATRKLTAGSGTFSESGTTVSFVRAYKVSAESGTFIETGTTAGLRATRLLSAVGATFLESGTAAILNWSGTSATLVAGAGAVNVSGSVAALYRNAVLATASGSFAETGTIAALYRGNLKLLAGPGDYFLTGSPMSLLRKALLTALSGSFVLSGTNAAINPGFKIIADSGTFLISGGVMYFPRPGSSRVSFIFQKRRDHFRI